VNPNLIAFTSTDPAPHGRSDRAMRAHAGLTGHADRRSDQQQHTWLFLC
jgi:hypothetical protein